MRYGRACRRDQGSPPTTTTGATAGGDDKRDDSATATTRTAATATGGDSPLDHDQVTNDDSHAVGLARATAIVHGHERAGVGQFGGCPTLGRSARVFAHRHERKDSR